MLKCQVINSSCFTTLHVLMDSIIDIFDGNFPGQETNTFSIRGSRAPLRYVVSVKFIPENVSNLYTFCCVYFVERLQKDYTNYH